MRTIKEYLSSDIYKEKVFPEIKRIFAVVFFTMMYGLGMVWFLEESVIPMYTGGIPGFAQVIRDLLVNKNIINEASGSTFMSIFVIVGNIPILLLGWFGVSKRFTIYSLISVLIQSLVIGFIPKISLGLSNPSQALLAAILGGLFIGVGIGGALRYGTSTGGFDIVAQYFSLKKGISVGYISMGLNVLIAFLGAVITGGRVVNDGSGDTILVASGLIFSYTIIRIIITTVATDKIHTSYHYLSIEIITENPNQMVDAILHKIGRGVTLSKVEGAYSHHEKTLVMVVISTYELQTVIDLIKKIDDKAFVVAKPVKGVIGNFAKKRIA